MNHLYLSDHLKQVQYPLAVVRTPAGCHRFFNYHDHNYTEITIVTQGNAIHCIGDYSAKLSPGDVIALPPHVAHGYKNGETLGVINLLCLPEQLLAPAIYSEFQNAFFGGQAPETIKPFPILHLEQNCLNNCQLEVSLLEMEIRNHRKLDGISLVAKFCNCIQLLLSGKDSRTDAPVLRYHFASVISYLNHNYNKQIDIDSLCAMTNMSRRNFFRRFREYVGSTPLEYLTEIRISNACSLLRNTQLSMLEIATECGFCDGNFLAKKFRQYCKMSPRQYRLQYSHK